MGAMGCPSTSCASVQMCSSATVLPLGLDATTPIGARAASMAAVTATPEADLRRYVAAVQALLERGGYERSGRSEEAKRWSLDHIRSYLDATGSPEVRATVHIAGTKGKGSTATMVESILRHAGAHTLLETSPDLHRARERIAIDGEPIGEAAFAALAERLLADKGSEGWSYFELLTMMGWLAAAEAGCDWQVLEVGLGGRLDTTNAVRAKAVAVVTPIDLEHTRDPRRDDRRDRGRKSGDRRGCYARGRRTDARLGARCRARGPPRRREWHCTRWRRRQRCAPARGPSRASRSTCRRHCGPTGN